MPEIQILAKDIEPGDVWLGDGTTELRIDHRVPGETRNVVPWTAGRGAIPVPMQMVLIGGVLTQADRPDFAGSWTLQPDQPIVVRRG